MIMELKSPTRIRPRRPAWSTTLLTLASLGLLWLSSRPASAQEWLDQVDDALGWQSRDGFFRTDLSGLIDLETYYVDQNPPGLIFPNDDWFFNPRLSLFLDSKLGNHFYSLVQVRLDRGFDPGARRDGDLRADEYLLRYTPFDQPTLNFQLGKFATVFGNWVPRHDSWNNPFITAPLPYENMTITTDQAVPGAPGGFLGRQARPDQKAAWLPVIWGPAYTTGGSVFGALDCFDYALEWKNAAISSRPTVWDDSHLAWDAPTWSGRIGYRPDAMWNIGSSVSFGPYLQENAQNTLAGGQSFRDFDQLTVGTDLSWAWHHWQIWAEAIASRFEVPNVGDADSLAYYVEAKYKFTPRLFGALRWNQQLFDDVPNGAGGFQPWDQDIWRAEAALGYRFTRHLQGKVQYGYSHQKGPFQQGEQLLAAQLTLKF